MNMEDSETIPIAGDAAPIGNAPTHQDPWPYNLPLTGAVMAAPQPAHVIGRRCRNNTPASDGEFPLKELTIKASASSKAIGISTAVCTKDIHQEQRKFSNRIKEPKYFLETPPERKLAQFSKEHHRQIPKWRWPILHLLHPGARFLKIHKLQGGIYRHRDAMSRVFRSSETIVRDRYLDPNSARVKLLKVQVTGDVSVNGEYSWKRTKMQHVGPLALRLSYWPSRGLSTIPIHETSNKDLAIAFAKNVVAAIALPFVLPFSSAGGEVRNGGKFDPLPYKFWKYAKVHKNRGESDGSPEKQSIAHWSSARRFDDPDFQERRLWPGYLCYLDDSVGNDKGYVCRETDPHGKLDEYLFVAYEGDQFPKIKLNGKERHMKKDLLQMAVRATKEAGLTSFWIAEKCLDQYERKSPAQRDPCGVSLEEKKDRHWNVEVNRINDIIRLAKGVAIVLGWKLKPRSRGSGYVHERSTMDPDSIIPLVSSEDLITGYEDMLKSWGSRPWTFTEALLCPSSTIAVYQFGQSRINGGPVEIIPKSHFPTRVWEDAHCARQLVDHVLGNLHLSRLELLKIAIKCLDRRIIRKENISGGNRFKGELAYILMGLLRRRIDVDSNDSEFQAIARLSLVNDSDLIMERFISLLPLSATGHWFTADDSWGCEFWDIIPACQVSAICEDDTLILDGCRAASIRWHSFARVAQLRKGTWKKWFALVFLRINIVILFVATLVLSLASPYDLNAKTAGGFLLAWGIVGILVAPFLVRVVYGGKLWGQQPWLFGFEGYLPIEKIEGMIFGSEEGRLSWSTHSSTLSRHWKNPDGECEGRDPKDDNDVQEIIKQAAWSKLGEQKVFTLVDTHTMTVTLFTARKPPVAAVVCGAEGGMQRAVLCSYDWATGTLFRETVLRMETTVLDVMPRVPRIKFGFHIDHKDFGERGS